MMLKRKEFIVGAVVGLSIAAVATAGGALDWPDSSAQPRAPQEAQLLRTSNGQAVFAPPPGAPLSFADIFDRVSPAVVSIDVRSRVDTNALRRIPGFENFPFELLPRQPGQEGQEAPETLGSGSGFFISADGYIVTNNHVVANAEEITVRLSDERELKAEVVGRDQGTDLAVIKVEGRDFPYVTFATEARPRVGDWVIAVGNPFQLGGTATAGIISAYGRDIGEQYVDYIQIDAPINRGNSGGPTFDIYGRVIGVNTAIFSPNGFSVGIGFAIPADVADNITKQLIAGGRVNRGYLGVTIGSVTEEMQEALNLPSRNGAIVTDVTPGGPADRAGVELGDIVVKLNGEEVEDNTALTRRVGQARAGDVLRLEVLRNGRTVQLQVRSGVRPTEDELNRLNADEDDADGEAAPAPQTPGGAAVLGLNLAPVDEAARRRFNLGADVRGLVITAVNPRSDAGRKGVRAGDVVVRADNRPVPNVAALQAIITALRQADRPSVLLLINRNGQNIPVPIDLETPSMVAPATKK